MLTCLCVSSKTPNATSEIALRPPAEMQFEICAEKSFQNYNFHKYSV